MKKIVSLIAFLIALGIVLALSTYGNDRSRGQQFHNSIGTAIK